MLETRTSLRPVSGRRHAAVAVSLFALSSCSSEAEPPLSPAMATMTSATSGTGTTTGVGTTGDTTGATVTSAVTTSSSTTTSTNTVSGSSSGSVGGATSTSSTVSGAGGSTATTTSVGGMSMGGSAGAGTTTTGMGGAGGTAGGGSVAADPSPGCGNANPATGSAQSPLMVSGHQYYVKLPNGYDANQPYLALFMFNPTGNPIDWAENNAGFESNGAADSAIRIYPHPANSSAGWGAGDVAFFEPLYDAVTADYCIDRARMFAAGESSGGDFSSILGCEFADKLRGVAPCATKPVGGYPLDANQRSCTGQVTSVVIHGANDSVVGPDNGPLTRDFYVDLNNCGDSSEPVAGYTDPMSNCIQYQGCDEGYPVFWCQHTDPEYSNTNHGWPRFAADMLWELFSSY